MMPDYHGGWVDHFPKTPYGFATFPDSQYFALFRDGEHLGNLFGATQEGVDSLLAALSGQGLTTAPPRGQKEVNPRRARIPSKDV